MFFQKLSLAPLQQVEAALTILTFILVVTVQAGVPIPGPNPNPNPGPNPDPNPDPNPAPNDESDTANNNGAAEVNGYRVDHHATPMKYDANLRNIARTCATWYTIQVPGLPDGITDEEFAVNSFPRQCTGVSAVNGNELIFRAEKDETEDNLVFAKQFQTWYGELSSPIINYNFENPKYSTVEAAQHGTQLVWKGTTTTFGCACEHDKGDAEGAKYVCSCIFTPGGNVHSGFEDAGLTAYKTNVLAK